LLLSIMILAVCFTGIAVYILVRPLELRIKRLEQAASQFAHGNFDTRVRVSTTDPLYRLGQAFNTMAEHIKRLLDVQREMIRAVSHELRTPVARIRFGLQIV